MSDDLPRDHVKKLRRLDEQLLARLEQIGAEAERAMDAVIVEYEAQRRELLIGAFSGVQRIADNATYPSSRLTESFTRSATKRPVRTIILEMLGTSDGNLPVRKITEAVEREGWSKNAGDKMRRKLRREGLVAADNMLWSLTESGRRFFASGMDR